MPARLLLLLLLFAATLVKGQSVLSLPYFDSSKLSAGYQSNRIIMVNAGMARFNVQVQSSVVNDQLRAQLFNVCLRYNLGDEKTRVIPSISFESNYGFDETVVRSMLEIQQKLGIFTAATMTGWDFNHRDLLYQLGLNARVTSKLYLQSSFGNYRMEIFGAEKSVENGLVITAAPLAMRFYNVLPLVNGSLEFRYSRFITSFLITILNKS